MGNYAAKGFWAFWLPAKCRSRGLIVNRSGSKARFGIPHERPQLLAVQLFAIVPPKSMDSQHVPQIPGTRSPAFVTRLSVTSSLPRRNRDPNQKDRTRRLNRNSGFGLGAWPIYQSSSAAIPPRQMPPPSYGLR
jgi:hypothetical protein